MKGWLIIPVNYKGEQLEFKGKLLKGKGKYGYKIKVKIDGGVIVFEEDVNGKFRVSEHDSSMIGSNTVEDKLLLAITNTIEAAVNIG